MKSALDNLKLMLNKKILVLPGDGIGVEVMNEVLKIIDWMS